MSHATIRAAVQTFFTGTAGIAEVYAAQPDFVDGRDFSLANGVGCVAFVHLDNADETRITLSALQGYKQVMHEIGLVLMYQYLIPSGTTVPQQPDAWVAGLDAIIDAVKARLRADPSCGTGYQPVTPTGVVFQAGEEPQDIVVRQDLPRRMAGKVISWNLVLFKLVELVVA